MKRGFLSTWKGFSLIEMMIALMLGSILILGLVQVFAASRASYALSEGLSRVQENGRFAMDYLQRDLRMVGHFGCANDQFRLQRTDLKSLDSHLEAGGALDFTRSIQGYEATNTKPGATVTLLTDAQIASPSAWSGTPALPAFITGATHKPLPGSDVIVIRYLAGEGVPVSEVTSNGVRFDNDKWSVFTQEGISAPGLFGVADCTYADIFQATSAVAGNVTATKTGLNTTDIQFASRYTAHPAGQTTLYRAEVVAYYVSNGAAGGPSLYRVRYRAVPGGAAMARDEEELVEGVENLQLIYGLDQSNDVLALTGNIGAQNDASALGTTETNWRRVGQVRIGLLMRSPDRSAAAQATVNPSMLGTAFKLPGTNDGRYRATYESTVALRNRLYSAQ